MENEKIWDVSIKSDDCPYVGYNNHCFHPSIKITAETKGVGKCSFNDCPARVEEGKEKTNGENIK